MSALPSRPAINRPVGLPMAAAKPAALAPANEVVTGPRLPTAPGTMVAITPPAGPVASQGFDEVEEFPEADTVSKGAQKAAAKPGPADRVPAYRVKRSQRAPQLTSRDLAMLRHLARFKFSTTMLIASSDIGMPLASLRRRLPKLQREGLVVSFPTGASKFLLWRCTEEGAQWAGLDLANPKKVSPTTVTHDLALVDLGVRFEAAGEMVVTEREIRAADTRNGITGESSRSSGRGGRILTTEPKYAVRLASVPGVGHMHIPDMLLVREPVDGVPRMVAIEYERSAKAPRFVVANLTAYRRDPKIASVIYYIDSDNQTVRRLLQKTIAETRTEGFVELRDYVPSPSTGLIQWD